MSCNHGQSGVLLSGTCSGVGWGGQSPVQSPAQGGRWEAAMAGLKRANAMSSPLAQRPPLFDVTHVHDAETRQTLLDLQLGRWVPPSHLTVRDHRLSPLPAERGVCVVHSAAQLERQRSRLDFHRNHEAGKLTTLIHGVRAPFSHSPTSLSLPHSF